MSFNNVLTKLNDFMYTYVLIIMLVGVGLYFTIRTKGVQFRLLKDGIKSMLEKSEVSKEGEKKVSSFQALMISTASRVGTGNIAGIATAIASGGPGAVFWMWIMALVGGASAFVESTLAQVYKVKENGGFRGGPSYYMEKALGKRWMGILFSILLIICFAYGFNGLQSYNISSTLEYYINDYSNTMYPMIVGIVLAVLTGLIIWGGAHRIGFISSVIVPIMAVVYIMMGLVTMIMNITELPDIFALIIKNAFDFKAMAGGFAGSAVVIGIKRGLFSNEAGMGSAPNASASADVVHPVKQGLVQIISVFIDTILICTSTAMMLLISGVEGKTNIQYVQAAISKNVGEWGIHFILISIFAFAFSSVIGNYFYAESNILFIKNSKVLLNVFRCTCLIAVFLGAQSNLELVWNIADISMGFMAIVNIIAIFILSKIAFKTLDNYEKQKKQGKKPVFYEDEIGLTGTVWTRDAEKIDK
ncbi:MAG: alanine:cation symporter family protein [Lachnospiraceae bacterium]|nr:alanine:cation symporter family protein [Lachnospiraceae bacterium]